MPRTVLIKELSCPKYLVLRLGSPGLGYAGRYATLPNSLRGSQGSLIINSIG